MQYTELKSYSHYSFLRGASSSEQLIRESVKLGLNGLAITDLGGVYGLPKALHSLRELLREDLPDPVREKIVDFNLISGSEIIFKNEEAASVVLIAPTRAAYGAMCRILTRSHANEAKGVGALSREDFFSLLESEPHAKNILLFPQWEEEWLLRRGDASVDLSSGSSKENWLRKWEQFADLKNQVYLPLARHLDGLDQERTLFARAFSRRLDLELVAHQGVLVHHSDQQIVQDTLTSIREGVPLVQLGRRLQRNAEKRLKSPEEMHKLFADLPHAIAMTQLIREQCVFSLDELRYRYPTEWIPAQHTAQSYLEELCAAGIKKRYPQGASDQVLKQLHHELSLIQEMKFADYFLTVYDIVDFARREKILCQGRGSAANSIVCFVLEITAIDPIRMDFLFERFISVERGEPPDIDVDFEHERREEIIQYIYKKYGRDRAAMVSAVVTYRDRSALREVAKAFSFPVGTLSAREVERKLMREEPNQKLVSEKTRDKILEVVELIQGFPRHLSIHSGGFTLSHEPVDTLVPIEPATMEGRTIIQWDKFDLDILGLLKIDVLSLGMLSAIRKNLDYAGLGLYDVPAEDPATYEMICRADTIGVFQIESRAQMSMLPRLRPENFYDLVVEIALVRPGPIVGKMVHPYLEGRAKVRRGEKISFPHPALVPILKKTFGVPIFQEQIMKMAVSLAKFSPGESDRLRRAIGAWRSQGSIDEMGMKLKLGLKKAGIKEDYAQRIFDQIQGFAEYGFPESHAASFALLTYVSCYLKKHYPAAFLCSLLNSQPMGFYSPHSLIDDAKRHGVVVLPASVNESDWDCSMVDSNSVRLGLRYIQSLPEEAGKIIISARVERSFSRFADFISRTHCEARHLRAIAMAGGFECLGLNARDALFEVLALQEDLFQVEEVQTDLFSKVKLAPMDAEEKVVQDYRAMGLSTRAHPMEFLRKKLRTLAQTKRRRLPTEIHSQRVKAMENGSFVTLPGLSVVLQRPPTAKGTAFATLEDEFGVLDLIFHKKFFDQYKNVIREQMFFWVSGVLQREGYAAQLIVKKIEPIFTDYEVPISPGDYQRVNQRPMAY